MRGVLKPREERIANDAYLTPLALADAICVRLDEVLQPPRIVLEPAAGAGAFMAAADRRWRFAQVFGVDTAPQLPRIEQFNFLHAGAIAGGIVPSLILGNPPYLLAEEFVRHAHVRLLHGGHVAFLLRLSFLAGQRRAALYEQYPLRYLIPITPRPSFTPDGKTDASEYGVFVWQRGYTGTAEILPHLQWTKQTRLLP